MIREIQIQNLSIVESARIEFQKGFHVISGETGAGKSILVTAIDFALGARGESELIRSGQEEASVTLSLDGAALALARPILEASGIVGLEDEGCVFLRRTLNASGRSRAFVNDQPVTLKTLQALGETSVHLVAQHATQKLLDEIFLLQGLDRAGGCIGDLQSYQEAYRGFRALRAEFREWAEKVEKSRVQEDFLRFQLQELGRTALRPGEEEELESKKRRLKHGVTLASHAFEMQDALVEAEDSVAFRLGRIHHLAVKAAQLDPALLPVAECVAQASGMVQEAGRTLSNYSRDLEAEPGELDRIEARLAVIAELKRKYRLEISGLIERESELKKMVEELEHFDERLETARRSLSSAQEDVERRARKLSESRKKIAQTLAVRLVKALKELALPHARIEFKFEAIVEPENYSEWGSDRLSLLVSFNPGEPLQAMDEVASGGELSRLLLAFCEILFPAQEFGTMIFDEVDTGVGGKVAELIGKKLESLSRRVQVLCVTHLPQIACHGAWHYAVEKEVHGGRTFSKVALLKGQERVTEIARMLAGVKITEQALEHAKELLKNAAA